MLYYSLEDSALLTMNLPVQFRVQTLVNLNRQSSSRFSQISELNAKFDSQFMKFLLELDWTGLQHHYSLGLYFHFFAHLVGITCHAPSHSIKLTVIIVHSQSHFINYSLPSWLLALFRLFACFRFSLCIFSRNTRRHAWSDMPHTLSVHLGLSRLYFRLLSAIFAYIHFLAFLHLIAFLFGFLVLYSDNFQDLGSCLVSFTLYLGLARSVISTHMI